MSGQNNNNKKSEQNQLDTNQSVNHRNNKVKKVEKLQSRLFKEDLGFTQLLNETINEIKDPCTLGVYCYLASKPEEWIICKKQIREHFKIGVDKLDKIFKRLIEFGLLSIVREKENGKFTGIDYYLHLRINPANKGVDSTPVKTTPMERPPIYINKDNINKDIKEKIYKKENDCEIDEVIEKAQECLDNTKTKLPTVIGEVKNVEYQETNFPVSKKQKPLSILDKINTLGLSSDFLIAFLEVRKANGAVNSEHALKASYEQLAELYQEGYNLEECLKIYANCGWKGFFASWVKNVLNSGKVNQAKHEHSEDTSWINNVDLAAFEKE